MAEAMEMNKINNHQEEEEEEEQEETSFGNNDEEDSDHSFKFDQDDEGYDYEWDDYWHDPESEETRGNYEEVPMGLYELKKCRKAAKRFYISGTEKQNVVRAKIRHQVEIKNTS